MKLDDIKNVTKDKFTANTNSTFMELELSKIYPNPEQPRKEFDNKSIADLGMEIEKDGLLQPIVVVKRSDGYMIVSGERRYRAHKWMCVKTIQANIINIDNAKVLELALIENIQREDLTDFEIAVHIGKLWASGDYKQKQDLAVAIGKSQSYISKAFGCLKLNKEIVSDIEEAKHNISLSVLEELSRVKDKDSQKEAYSKYLSKEITRDGIAEYRDLKMETQDCKRSKPKDKKFNSIQSEEEKILCKLIEELKIEIKELQTKELYIISYTHKRGVPHGGGHRVRAINKKEALELGREYYKDQAQDKKYIFEAVTLKENETFCNKFGKRKWIVNELDVSGEEEDGHSWYSTEAYLQYFKLSMPKNFPNETTPQRYKITIEEL